jgi:hypothetical protein
MVCAPWPGNTKAVVIWFTLINMCRDWFKRPARFAQANTIMTPTCA